MTRLFKILFFSSFTLFATFCSNSTQKDTTKPVVAIPDVIVPPVVVINDPVTPISDIDALDLVQRDCLKYFWEYPKGLSHFLGESAPW